MKIVLAKFLKRINFSKANIGAIAEPIMNSKLENKTTEMHLFYSNSYILQFLQCNSNRVTNRVQLNV